MEWCCSLFLNQKPTSVFCIYWWLCAFTVGGFLSQYGWHLLAVTLVVYFLIQHLQKRRSSQSHHTPPPQTQGQQSCSPAERYIGNRRIWQLSARTIKPPISHNSVGTLYLEMMCQKFFRHIFDGIILISFLNVTFIPLKVPTIFLQGLCDNGERVRTLLPKKLRWV